VHAQSTSCCSSLTSCEPRALSMLSHRARQQRIYFTLRRTQVERAVPRHDPRSRASHPVPPPRRTQVERAVRGTTPESEPTLSTSTRSVGYAHVHARAALANHLDKQLNTAAAAWSYADRSRATVPDPASSQSQSGLRVVVVWHRRAPHLTTPRSHHHHSIVTIPRATFTTIIAIATNCRLRHHGTRTHTHAYA
jgi:hypothetical protein